MARSVPHAATTDINWTTAAIILVIVLIVVTKIIKKINRERRFRQRERQYEADKIWLKAAFTRRVNELCDQHEATLFRKARQGIYRDEYGILKTDAWRKSVAYFVDNVIKPDVELREIEEEAWDKGLGELTDDYFSQTYEKIANWVIEHLDHEDDGEINWSRLSPYEYEKACASMLRDTGWNARATQASGDQGADVVAEKDGIVVVLQCKQYSNPVGNKAVQEVHAAKTHYGAHYAAVVTNAVYTPSARQLAKSANVLLLHHDDLRDLDNLIDPVALPDGSALGKGDF